MKLSDLIGVPENEKGIVEYKLMLDPEMSEERKVRLSTQMLYRINQKRNESDCFYVLGMKDNGTAVGVSGERMSESLEILKQIASSINCSLSVIEQMDVEGYRKISLIKIVKNVAQPLPIQTTEKRTNIFCGIAGNVDSGKSTLLSCLLFDKTLSDDRNIRDRVANHKHEIDTHKTSTIGYHILGFTSKGNSIHYSTINKNQSWKRITVGSEKICSFLDLAGHNKYLKMTYDGLFNNLDMALIVIGANSCKLPEMTKEHMRICLFLGIPFAIILSKIDMFEKMAGDKATSSDAVLHSTLSDIGSFLIANKKLVSEIETVLNITPSLLSAFSQKTTVPFIRTNAFSGKGLDLIKSLVYQYNPPISHEEDHAELCIEATFIPVGVGIVVGGMLMKGSISVGKKYFIGPFADNVYREITVKTIYVNRSSVPTATRNNYVCIHFSSTVSIERKTITKRMMVVEENNRFLVSTVTARIKVLKDHSTTIKKNYCPLIHSSTFRQTVKFTSIKDEKEGSDLEFIRGGDSAVVHFRLLYRSVYAYPGQRFFITESKMKVVGKILAVNE